ncbi:hypothetical protein DAPPUDRAFT_114239 [Daphnia pulex]|uniref:RRM domain-containing protein n=1 Tax=Daphnia pulex TaxID=6669 RepID=E9HHH6_DAPPU|nr:hypothetical protein DAPPUDRAFT_114239 [Daphnia pulex]|eukprot:EFX68815.1 hypothetical protein DAPPUDRAFT_114239 [Daphnia pulex]
MEPSPKKQKSFDPRVLTKEDQELERKVMATIEKHLRTKNIQKHAVDDEVKALKEIIKRDASLRLYVKNIGVGVPLETIQEKFSVFGKVLEVGENPNPGLIRSVTITFYSKDSVVAAINMEPSPKKQKSFDPRVLTKEDQELERKVMATIEKHLRTKNIQKHAVDDEVKALKEIIKRDASLRLYVKNIGVGVPLETIQEKFSVFGKVLEVGENPNPGLIRSVTITFYSKDSVVAAINHPDPILLNSVVLKVTAWRPEEDVEPPGAVGATCKPESRQ